MFVMNVKLVIFNVFFPKTVIQIPVYKTVLLLF